MRQKIRLPWRGVAGALFVCTPFLAGCVAPAQWQAQAPATSALAPSVTDQLRSCTLAIWNSDDAAPLRVHTPYDVRDATLEQMTSRARASKAEIMAIYLLHPRIQSCRTAALNRIMPVAPGVAAVLGDAWAKSEQSVIELVQRKITWGEHVTRMKDLSAEATKELTVTVQQAYRDEAAQRQAALDAQARYYQTQQIINAIHQRTSPTNCVLIPTGPATPAVMNCN